MQSKALSQKKLLQRKALEHNVEIITQENTGTESGNYYREKQQNRKWELLQRKALEQKVETFTEESTGTEIGYYYTERYWNGLKNT